MMPTDLRSYLLGLFDGEGSIFVQYNSGTYSPKVGVGMASEAVVRLFQTEWGGSIYRRRKPSRGGLIMWEWHHFDPANGPFLQYVAAHSLVKRDQAVLALRLLELRREKIDRVGRARLTDAERAARCDLARQISSLNGARSRFVHTA